VKKNPAIPLIWFVILVGAVALMFPDSTFRDGLFAMQFAALAAAVYGFSKFYKK
jgi:hypothetical protein